MKGLGILGIFASWAGFFILPVAWVLPLGAAMVASVVVAVSGEGKNETKM